LTPTDDWSFRSTLILGSGGGRAGKACLRLWEN